MLILKNIVKIIKEWLFSPILILYFLSDEKKIILSDVRRWIEIRSTGKQGQSDIHNLLTLIVRCKEFRNVYYYRILQGNSISIAFLYIARTIYRASPRLIIREHCKIGPGLFIHHGWSTVVNADIGENCWINQQVTIGFQNGAGRPTIGNDVIISVAAIVLGNITVGDNVIIGANALVTKNVPPNCVVGGVPAVIIKRDGIRVNEKL